MSSFSKYILLIYVFLLTGCRICQYSDIPYYLYDAAVQPRWVTAENPNGLKASGGTKNNGAKGSAMYYLEEGEEKVLAEIKGPGIINRIWMTGGFVSSSYARRNLLIEIYWEGDSKPAVSAPVNDFFGMSLPIRTPFQSVLFSQPEGRSYNCFVQMPFKKSAKIVVKNYTKSKQMCFFEVDYSKVPRLPKNILYFHAYWHRDTSTVLGKDFEILPSIKGKGRFLGTSIGVMCDSIYKGSWFGEGEVKIFLDGDQEYPTLCGTGTEDYIGTGWGQNTYVNYTQGCPLANIDKGLFSFYRYHTMDPIFFHKDCKVTIQQMGNASRDYVQSLVGKGAILEPVSVWNSDRLLKIYDQECIADLFSDKFPDGGVNFWRSDDVCATAYFYLNSTSTDLPPIQNEEVRSFQLNLCN